MKSFNFYHRMANNAFIHLILKKYPLESDDSNYLDWKLKLQLIIRSEDLIDVLEASYD
jgi:hypothetical protein